MQRATHPEPAPRAKSAPNATDWVRPSGGNLGIGFSFDDVDFWVDPLVGGRIRTFAYRGHNLLTGPDAHPENFGSTFWTSPQSDWDWPPSEAVDTAPYAPEFHDDHFRLVGPRCERFGIRIEKRFAASRRRGSVTITYSIVNAGKDPVRFAPWEVTRVRGGLSFFAGGGQRFHLDHLPSVALEDALDVAWFAFDKTTIQSDQKVFAHSGQGWLAHVENDVLFIKSFPAIAENAAAPGEAMVEIYARGDHSYIELEEQGAFEEVLPGAQSDYTVEWFLRRIPASVACEVGSRELIDTVQSVVGGV